MLIYFSNYLEQMNNEFLATIREIYEDNKKISFFLRLI